MTHRSYEAISSAISDKIALIVAMASPLTALLLLWSDAVRTVIGVIGGMLELDNRSVQVIRTSVRFLDVRSSALPFAKALGTR